MLWLNIVFHFFFFGRPRYLFVSGSWGRLMSSILYVCVWHDSFMCGITLSLVSRLFDSWQDYYTCDMLLWVHEVRCQRSCICVYVTPVFMARLLHVWHDPHICDMLLRIHAHIYISHVICKWIISHIWMSHVTHEWVTSHIRMSHVTSELDVSHIKGSTPIFMGHMTYESCHICMSHVTYESVVSNIYILTSRHVDELVASRRWIGRGYSRHVT